MLPLFYDNSVYLPSLPLTPFQSHTKQKFRFPKRFHHYPDFHGRQLVIVNALHTQQGGKLLLLRSAFGFRAPPPLWLLSFASQRAFQGSWCCPSYWLCGYPVICHPYLSYPFAIQTYASVKPGIRITRIVTVFTIQLIFHIMHKV